MKLSSFFKYAAELMVALFLLNACSEKSDTENSAELLRKLKDPDPKIGHWPHPVWEIQHI